MAKQEAGVRLGKGVFVERRDLSVVFSKGVDLAKFLMHKDEAGIPDDAFNEAQEYLSNDVYETLVEWGPEHLNQPFMVLFVGNATVSYVARTLKGHRPLEPDDLRSYLAHSVEFHNDWSHNFY